MLGDKIGEESGKITSQRALPNLGGAPKMETTFQMTGSLLGVGHKNSHVLFHGATGWDLIRRGPGYRHEQ